MPESNDCLSEKQYSRSESTDRMNEKQGSMSESVDCMKEKQGSRCKLVVKIQAYILGGKIDVTKVLALLETKLTGFEMNIKEIMLDLTAVKSF